MEIKRPELTTLFAHYDYFTGRAIRIVLSDSTPKGLEAACQCIVLAKRNKCGWVSPEARDIAHDAYRTLASKATDIQLKVLECCAVSRPQQLQKSLLALLELELSKLVQTEIA